MIQDVCIELGSISLFCFVAVTPLQVFTFICFVLQPYLFCNIRHDVSNLLFLKVKLMFSYFLQYLYFTKFTLAKRPVQKNKPVLFLATCKVDMSVSAWAYLFSSIPYFHSSSSDYTPVELFLLFWVMCVCLCMGGFVWFPVFKSSLDTSIIQQ